MSRHFNPSEVAGRRPRSAGSAMVTMLLITFVTMVVVFSLLSRSSHNVHLLSRHSANQQAFNAAEAGLNLGLYMLRADSKWEQLPANLVAKTTISDGVSLSVAKTISPLLTDVTLRATGNADLGPHRISRTLEVKAKRAPPKALDYMMFANAVGFHNHMKIPYGLSISNLVWSNGNIIAHGGLTLKGEYTAVGEIKTSVASSTLPATDISKAIMQDGTPGSPHYAPDDGFPLPVPKPFPTYNFARAKTLATSNGTYFSTASTFNTYLLSKAQTFNPRQKYGVPIPQENDRNFKIALNDTGEYVIEQSPGVWKKYDARNNTYVNYDANKVGIERRIYVENAMFYVLGGITLSFGPDTVVIFQNCSLVAEGGVSFESPVELYGPTDEIAIATMGGLSIKGGNGPAHIEGVFYSLGTTHVHQTERYGSVYFAGIEIADYIHNCEWFQMEYKPYPNINGLNDSSVFGNTLKIYGWREIY